MNSRKCLSYLLSTALVLGSAQTAAANDAVSALGGFIAGAIVGNAVSNAQPRKVYVQERTVIHRAPVVNSYQREENRRVQTALNYFGFPAGVPDGVMGRNSRSAIADYQVYMGYPPSGVMSEYERVFLTSSYDRAVVGGPVTAQTIAASGQGVRGLLLAYRQEQLGGAPVQAAGAPPPVVAAPPAIVAAPQPVPAAVAVPEVVEVKAPASAGMPSFIAGEAAPSMASACNRTNIATNTNGGPVVFVAGETIDPTQTLAEQFCLARTYAIDQGESLAASAQGFTMAEIEEQCVAFAPSMREYAAGLTAQSPETATTGLRKFVTDTGLPAAQMSANARICLGVGYRTDNADLALAAAMVLVGLGEAPYGELVGYHLIDGFGTPKRPDLGLDWIGVAVDALSDGATPLVSANDAGRLDLLEATLTTLRGGGSGAAVVQDASVQSDGGMMALPMPKAPQN